MNSYPQFILEIFAVRSSILLFLALVAGEFLRKNHPAVTKTLLKCSLFLALSTAFLPTSLPQTSRPLVAIQEPAPQLESNQSRIYASGVGGNLSLHPGGRRRIEQVWEARGSHTLQAQDFATIQPLAKHLSLSLFNVWLVGALFFMQINFVGLATLIWLRRRGKPIEDEVLCEYLSQARARLKVRRTDLIVSKSVEVPCVAGLIWPTIFIPSSLLIDSQPAELQTLIEHELSHVKNHDYLWNLIARSASAVIWFNPLVWLTARRLNQVTESVCDLAVLESGLTTKKTYAASLLGIARKVVGKKFRLRPDLGIFEDESDLSRRIREILDHSTKSAKVTRTIKIAISTCCLFATVGAGTVVAGIVAQRVHIVPNYRHSMFGSYHDDPVADDLLERAMAPENHPGPLKATVHFKNRDGESEDFRITRSSYRGPSKVEVLYSRRLDVSKVYVTPGGDLWIPSTPAKPAKFLKPAESLRPHTYKQNLYPTNSNLGSVVALAGSRLGWQRGFLRNAVFQPYTSVDGKPLICIEQELGGGLKVRYLIDRTTGLIIEEDTKNLKSDGYLRFETLTDVEYGKSIDESQTTYQISPNLKLETITQKLIPQPIQPAHRLRTARRLPPLEKDIERNE